MLAVYNYLCREVEANVTAGETEAIDNLPIPATGSGIELFAAWWHPVTLLLDRSGRLNELLVDASDAFHPDFGPVTSSDIIF